MYSQLIFEFSCQDEYNLEKLIISECNRSAYNIINNWPDTLWGVLPYENSLLLRGPRNCGKTFLAKLWAKKNDAVFLKSDYSEFDYQLLSKHNCFILDEPDFSYEQNILHLFNIINEHKKYLLICIQTLPDIKLADLRSRLFSLNSTKIDSPDDIFISLLLNRLFESYAVKVKKEVINYLLNHLSRDFASINDFVKSINNYSLQRKQNITIPLIKKYFADIQ